MSPNMRDNIYALQLAFFMHIPATIRGMGLILVTIRLRWESARPS